ncbi:unnamed protein product [Caenorhabditis sp. 36 PRJEB53466]|nr:unnamed protein product [Caenorhabditis sp. 36 PRJEB53466]
MDDRMRMRWKEAKERVGNAYHDYGRLCAAHPKACLSMSLLTMIVLSYPTITRLRLPVSTPIDVFWSEHLHVNDKISPFWINENPASYIQQFIVSTSVDPWNATALGPEHAVRAAVATAFRIRELLLEEPAVEELCLRLATQRHSSPWPFRSKSLCVVLSPATIWYNDVQKFREDDDVIVTIFNEQCKSTFCMRDLLLGAPAEATGIKQKYQTNRKRNIEFAVTMFFARYSTKVIAEIRAKLHREFELIETPANDERTFVQVYFHPLKTFSDYIPLISTYFVCMIYVYFSSRKFQMVASRWGLAFASCFTVASTLLMTTGICAHLDLSTTTWGSEVYPYIALIMGLENTLCITRSVVYTPPSLDVSSRIAHGLSQEGYKLTKYYILELIALLIGFLTRISDIQEFCQFSVICVTVDFYMQLFFYAPCLTFDLERLGLEEKRKFAEILLYEEIPRLKNYAPVSCPMRKVWPKLFEMKKMQKRKLSDSGIEVLKEEQRRLLAGGNVDSKDDGDVQEPRPEESVRMKIMYFITRTRIVQRTILIVFAVWTVSLVFFVGSRQLGMESNLTNQSIESLTRSHRILSTANLRYGNWQRRTYKWWPAVAHEYNISLNSRYVTFLPPIVINAKVHPSHFMMQTIEKSQDVQDDSSEAPILRSRIDWLEMQLKMYLAAFWLLLITTVISFFAYVFLIDRWKVKGVQQLQEPKPYDGKTSGSQTTRNVVETPPIVFNRHLFPIESVAIDVNDASTFVSCCQEGIVYLWSTQTGQRILRLDRLWTIAEIEKEVPPPKVWALAKRNDVVILGCCDGRIEVVSISRNKLIGVHTTSTVGVSHIVCREEMVAVVRLDATIEFLKMHYDTTAGMLRVSRFESIKEVRAHQKPVCRVATWKDQLITSSFDRSIKMWNLENGELSNVFLSHNSPPINLAVDESKSIMYSSCEEGVICWWNLVAGELIRSDDNNCNWAFQLATSSDYLLGFYGSSQLFMWSVETGQLACRVTDASNDGSSEDTLYTVGSSGVVSFDDQVAATASSDSVTFWDLKHRAIIGKVKVGGKISSMRKLTDHSVLCGVDNLMYSVTVPLMAEERNDYPFATFLDQHAAQLNASAVPPELWHSLYKKLSDQSFDAGEYFNIIYEADDEKNQFVSALRDLHNNDEENIFLIDHFFSFSAETARNAVETTDGLAEKLAVLFGINSETPEADETVEKIETSVENEEKKHEETLNGIVGTLPRHESVDARLGSYSFDDPKTELCDRVVKELWKFSQTYSVSYQLPNGELDKRSVWYVMDNFGSRIRHSASPNARIIPLMFVPQQTAFSIMFLTQPVKAEEKIVRDWAANVISAQNPAWRKYIEIPWVPQDFSGESVCPPAPTFDYFTSGRNPDHLASAADQETCQSALFGSVPTMKNRKLKLFVDDTQLTEHLTRDVEYVGTWKKADIIWLIRHFHDYKNLAVENPCALINQFPYESCITVKDLLAACAMRDPVKNDWYQLTYNLNTQLPQFVARFQNDAKTRQHNVWIVKPWNLARGMEMTVTDDLNQIIRLVETGPKIVCQYIHRPLLFPRADNGNNVKFDLRYIVFLNGLSPVTAYVYNRFWIRFAINEFTLSNFDDVETHFTVFNYLAKEKVLQMKCEDFIKTIENTYPRIKWTDVQKDINATIRKAFDAAAQEQAPCGVAPNVQSRAMYGVDIMLQHGENDVIKPTLLEVNFMPDTTRACQYYPDFADTVFDTLFLDEIDPTKVTAI